MRHWTRGRAARGAGATLATLVAGFLLALALARQSTSAAAKAQGPTLAWDAGTILTRAGQPAPVGHVFQVVNPSPTSSLSLTLVQKSCGCTRIRFPTSPVGPGESCPIELEYDAPLGDMVKQESAVFSTNLAEMPLITCQLACRSVPRVSLAPDWTGHLVLQPGHTWTQDFQVTISGEPLPSEPLSIHVDGPGIEVQSLGELPARVVDGLSRRSFRCRATIAADDDETRWGETRTAGVRFACGADARRHSFTWRVSPYVSAIPRSLFVRLSGGEEHAARVRLHSEAPFRVVSVGPNTIVSVDIEGDSHSTWHELALRVHAAPSKTVEKHLIHVDIDHPRQSQVTVPLYLMPSE